MTVSDWADRYRIVSKPTPEPGPWQTARVPYMREIMDRLTPNDPCQIVALMKAAQGAGTEGGLNMLGCYMHQYPRDMMLVLPTTDSAKKFSRLRFDRMIEGTPVLRSLVVEPRSRDASNNVLLKEFGPGRDALVITGANSAVGLRSYPAGVVYADEIDGYPADLDGEGNPIYLLLQRTAAFADRKIFMTSTPTLEDSSNILHWFKAGDQREYFVPCPLCTRMQNLVWGADRVKRGELGGVRWPKGSPHLARYQCEHCGDQWEEWRKIEVFPRSEWKAQAPGNGNGLVTSYHVNALVYPYGWPGNSWMNLAAEWERDHKKPVARKAFVNLKEGLPYSDPTEAKADAAVLLSRCEAYGPELPAGVVILTAGADIQANRIEVEVIGWGAGEESWSIDYRVLAGDTSKPDGAVWKALDELLQSEYLSDTGISLGIRAACVDAGYNQDTVRGFCHERRLRNIWAIIGREGQGRPVWPLRTAKRKPGKSLPPIVLGVDTIKESVYGRLSLLEPGPGYCHFPIGRGREYFDMLTAETRIPDYSGPVPTYHWVKKNAGVRNEALDARGYGFGALRGLEVSTAFRLEREVERMRRLLQAKLEPAVPQVAPAEAKPSWIGPRKEWF